MNIEITPQLIQEVVKGGVAFVLSIGLCFILYAAVAGDKEERRFLNDHMARQTAALEVLADVYSGGQYEKPNLNPTP